MTNVFTSSNNSEFTSMLKEQLFLDSFVGYTNRLFQKTHKKISGAGQLTKVYNSFCVADLNSKRTYNSLKEYPSAKRMINYVLQCAI